MPKVDKGKKKGESKSNAAAKMSDIPDAVAQWAESNTKRPEEVAQTNTRYQCHFICSGCKHPFQKSARNYEKSPYCPFCHYKTQVCGASKSECSMCWNNSWASLKQAEYWDIKTNEDKKPENYTKGSGEILAFICPICSRSFKSNLSNVRRSPDGVCPCPHRCHTKKAH